MTASLVKMMGYPQAGPNDPNSYTAPYGCREYLRDTVRAGPTPFKWMRVHLQWAYLSVPTAPNATTPPYPLSAGIGAAFDYYNTNPQAQIHFTWLDDAIRACNDDGIFVNLCLGQYYPEWVSPNTPAFEPGTENDPAPDSKKPKPRSQRLPTDVSTSSYWAHWVTYVYNRYHAVNYQGVRNDRGPSAQTGYWGNPERAWIGAFEFCNEPNAHAWNATDGTPCRVAEMFQTVDAILSFWGPACGVIGPATSDYPHSQYKNGKTCVMDYYTFTDNTLWALRNWRPANYFAWSHHNYWDMGESVGTPDGAYPKAATLTRLNKVVDRLKYWNWRGGGDRNVWVTEGGYNLKQPGTFPQSERTKQVNAIEATWRDYKEHPNTVSFAQYRLNNNPDDNWFSGLTTVGYFDPPPAHTYQVGSPLPGWSSFAYST